MCFDTVEGARPSNSMIWQTQSSPLASAIRARNRLPSPNAFVMSNTSCIYTYYNSPYNEVYNALRYRQEIVWRLSEGNPVALRRTTVVGLRDRIVRDRLVLSHRERQGLSQLLCGGPKAGRSPRACCLPRIGSFSIYRSQSAIASSILFPRLQSSMVIFPVRTIS